MNLTLETHASTIPAQLESRLRDHSRTMQVMPEIATRAIDIAREPDCSFDEFARVVDRDAKLASDILCIANSAMFGTSQPILALHQAVIRLGLRQCRNLIVGSCMASLSKGVVLPDVRTRDLLCRHGFLTAVIASGLNNSLGAGFEGEEFAAALMHDFGRTLLALCVPDEFAEVDSLSFDERGLSLELERKTAGADHCEVGAWFALFKKLPVEFAEVMQYHHRPAEAGGSQRLVSLVAVADDMANHLARCGATEGYNASECEAVHSLRDAGVSGDVQLVAEQLMPTALSAADSMLEL
jgi:HD-like signal output (HDOD) protein